MASALSTRDMLPQAWLQAFGELGRLAVVIGIVVLPLVGLQVALSADAAHGLAPRYDASAAQDSRLSFSMYVLSKGGGVSEGSLNALGQFREMLEGFEADGTAVQLIETHIGLEGERRLCAEFVEKVTAAEAWRRAESIVANVQLANLKWEPCNH